jgi:2-desacetyl-2-hydroxyethyl bacteriochlorophyllide A dehydrogenase
MTHQPKIMMATHYEGHKRFSVLEKGIESPSQGEVQIKVAYCGVCGTDMHIFHGNMDARVDIPVTIGHEMSGVISAIGAGVQEFSVGDQVVVRPLDSRGEKSSDKGNSHICQDLKFIGIDSPGAMQQYWNVPAFVVHKLSSNTDLRLAALVEPLAVACHDVKRSRLQKGETAVVLGGGPIGLLVAMVAKTYEANVIISEVNPVRIALAKKLGFTTVDSGNSDLVAVVSESTEGRLADVVFEVAGVQQTVDVMTDVAGIRSRIVMVAIHALSRPVNLFKIFWKELELIGARVYEEDDYEKAIELITKNELPFEELITVVAPLSDIQNVFEMIDKNPDGMKVLLDCQN